MKDPRPKTHMKTDLGFDMVDDSPNEKLPLIIRATIANHEVARILVDHGSSCDIM
jgi:hypothetical protein